MEEEPANTVSTSGPKGGREKTWWILLSVGALAGSRPESPGKSVDSTDVGFFP
jgi:hypothetical protein